MPGTSRHSTPKPCKQPGGVPRGWPRGLQGAESPRGGSTGGSCSLSFRETAFSWLSNLLVMPAPKDCLPVNSHHKIPVKITSVDS